MSSWAGSSGMGLPAASRRTRRSGSWAKRSTLRLSSSGSREESARSNRASAGPSGTTSTPTTVASGVSPRNSFQAQPSNCRSDG